MKKILIFLTLFSFYFVNAADFLMPDEAFKPYAKVNEKMQIEVGIELGNDIYLYAEQTEVKLASPSQIVIQKIQKPQSTLHHDAEVYLSSPRFLLDLAAVQNLSKSVDVTFLISYQGCSEQ